VTALKSTVAIIGGAGFVSGWLARHFAKNFEIIILDVKDPEKDLQGTATYISCDVRNYKNVAEALENVDLVIHTAIVQIPLINEQKRLGYEVNVNGTQNVCRAVEENSRIKGLILSGSWHTIGERDLKGVIDEEFGFRPDKVEDRARLYALSKIAQESIVRFFDEISEKTYGIIRMGTVLGEGMPEKTAANIFIENGLTGRPLTPYKHSMYRPMLYVNINDVCIAYEQFANKILHNEINGVGNSLDHIFNVLYPEPITILELAEAVRNAIIKVSNEKIKPEIKIVDKGIPMLFSKSDKTLIEADIRKSSEGLGINRLISPKESIERIVRRKLQNI
jgi:nucleoside-diphosphate-sugar epimerase